MPHIKPTFQCNVDIFINLTNDMEYPRAPTQKKKIVNALIWRWSNHNFGPFPWWSSKSHSEWKLKRLFGPEFRFPSSFNLIWVQLAGVQAPNWDGKEKGKWNVFVAFVSLFWLLSLCLSFVFVPGQIKRKMKKRVGWRRAGPMDGRPLVAFTRGRNWAPESQLKRRQPPKYSNH